MAVAEYIIQIPRADNHGNQLGSVAEASARYLWNEYGLPGAKVRHHVTGLWEGEGEPFDELVLHADDTPENDSIVRALATRLAKVCGQWEIYTTKQEISQLGGGKNPQYNWEEAHPDVHATGVEGLPDPAQRIEDALRSAEASSAPRRDNLRPLGLN